MKTISIAFWYRHPSIWTFNNSALSRKQSNNRIAEKQQQNSCKKMREKNRRNTKQNHARFSCPTPVKMYPNIYGWWFYNNNNHFIYSVMYGILSRFGCARWELQPRTKKLPLNVSNIPVNLKKLFCSDRIQNVDVENGLTGGNYMPLHWCKYLFEKIWQTWSDRTVTMHTHNGMVKFKINIFLLSLFFLVFLWINVMILW